jgi:hypothetical protein
VLHREQVRLFVARAEVLIQDLTGDRLTGAFSGHRIDSSG